MEKGKFIEFDGENIKGSSITFNDDWMVNNGDFGWCVIGK